MLSQEPTGLASVLLPTGVHSSLLTAYLHVIYPSSTDKLHEAAFSNASLSEFAQLTLCLMPFNSQHPPYLTVSCVFRNLAISFPVLALILSFPPV